MPIQRTNRITCTVVLLASFVLLGACAGDRVGFTDPFAPTTPATPPKPAGPPIAMAGRWLLAASNGAMCGMNFTSMPDGTSGKIAPEGGCPGRFFTSRQWAFEQGALVILDHKEQPLARLASSDTPGSFQGRANGGLSVSLTR